MKTTVLRLPGLLLILGLPPAARAQTVTVAADGSGQFRTVQEALNSLPDAAAKPRTVFLKNGTCREKIYLDGKAKLVLKGQSEKGVVLTYPQARDLWLCGPGATAGDWGVATLNLRNCPDITLENLTVVNSYGFEATGEVVIDCPTAPTGQKTASKTGHQMALPGTTRLVVRHCTFRALGGDTVSPWDTEAGAYYFKDCTMEGGVDFYCPRGWAYAENGIRYLLKMQYANGGFPQFYPDLSSYRHEITYSDDAMVRALTVLRRVARQEERYALVRPDLVGPAKDAVARGLACILKTQVVQHGRPTAWCAQYVEVSLPPAKARAFELASLSGEESVGIVRFLMDTEQPTPEIKAAVAGAVAWFEQVRMPGFALKEISAPQEPRGIDRVLVAQPGAVLWARFYELGTNRPIYVGRDSQVRYQLREIENERRAGYLHAGTWPAELLAVDYPAWLERVGKSARMRCAYVPLRVSPLNGSRLNRRAISLNDETQNVEHLQFLFQPQIACRQQKQAEEPARRPRFRRRILRGFGYF